MVALTINRTPHLVSVDPSMPLLWFLRDCLGFTGTKYGCGIGACGACTVHVNGVPTRSCLTRVASVDGAAVTTIEGLAIDGRLHVVQEAWLAEDVVQCGYCQPGQLMAAAALLRNHADPTDADITNAMSGNICRCGTYGRVRAAIKRAAQIDRTP
jgi:isoquinoline 1-oxidoreductase alpha subunit